VLDAWPTARPSMKCRVMKLHAICRRDEQLSSDEVSPIKCRRTLSKSTFNAKNFICSLSLSISIDFSTIGSWTVSCSQKSPNNLLKPLLKCSRSSKVIALGANWKPLYDFLLEINSNLGPISHRFRDRPTATYWLKITSFFYPVI